MSESNVKKTGALLIVRASITPLVTSRFVGRRRTGDVAFNLRMGCRLAWRYHAPHPAGHDRAVSCRCGDPADRLWPGGSRRWLGR